MTEPLRRVNHGMAAGSVVLGQRTVEDVVRVRLTAVNESESGVGAWAFIDHREAIAQARRKDATGPCGSLHGVTVGLKDIIDTKDMPTSYGSRAFLRHVPNVDAEVTKRLKSAGALVLGKTVTTEFALWEPGKTRNPLNLMRTPGGSSSGSAAAVAAGMVCAAVGTQTGGSVVRPAAFCGVFGFKPTYGILDYRGVWCISPTLDTLGLFATDIDTIRLVFDQLLVGNEGLKPCCPGRSPRIGFARTAHWSETEPYTRTALEGAARALVRQGIEVVDVTLPKDFPGLIEAHKVIMDAEAAHALAGEAVNHGDLLSQSTHNVIARGNTVTALAYQRALKLAVICKLQSQLLFAHCDALLTPAVAGEAPNYKETGDPLFCRTWTLLGCPALNVPGLYGPSGLPVGVQLVGQHHDDLRLLDIGCSVASALSNECR